jgi:hypothetical protein
LPEGHEYSAGDYYFFVLMARESKPDALNRELDELEISPRA